MTALSAARQTASKNTGGVKQYLMAASTTIYAGSMVMIDSSGLAVPAAAGASNHGVVGVAQTTVTSAASGSYYIDVEDGWFLFAGATLGQDDVGKVVYAADDQTLDETYASNLPVAGVLVEYVSASSGWVDISPQYSMIHSLVEKKVYHELVFSIPLASIADGDIITGITPGYAGTIEKMYSTVTTVASTASKLTTLNLEIGTTNLTGGALALTTANCDTLGETNDATSITANNTFSATDTISVEASSTTAFIEGQIDLVILVSETISL